ncbi:MAG: HIT family protein [Candidatus Helarchaeota archaeon]
MEKNFREYRFIDKINYVKAKKSDNCIFCNPKDSKDLIVYQTDKIIILLNKYPYNPAHLLIAPKKHVGKLEELSDSETLHIINIIKKAMKLLQTAYSPTGFNVGLNLGKAAGASIVTHLHFHLVPRYDNELGFMDVIGGTRMIVERLEDTLKKLKENIEILKDS